MFQNFLNFLKYLTILCFYLKNSIDGCITPLGAFGAKMHVMNCEPIIWLLRKYETELPALERLFIRKSFLATEAGENHTMVCCDVKMNVTADLKAAGARILQNMDGICGDNTFKRVSFGVETTFMSHPWSALLVYDTPQRFQCGGSLITNQYVLTAAHCVSEDYYPLIAVRLREHNTTAERDCAYDLGGFEHCYAPYMDIGIEKIVRHKNYSKITNENDIALLRLAQAIEFERSIRPICLPEYQNQTFDKEYGIIIGWGATENAHFSDVLLEAEVPIHNLDYCRQIYRRRRIDDTRICGTGRNATDTCKGDSGGPFIVRIEGYMTGRKFRYLQVGLVSLGVARCGDARSFPTIFLRTASYRNWIAENIEL